MARKKRKANVPVARDGNLPTLTGFPCFLLTVKKGPDLKSVWIRGDEMDAEVTYSDDGW